MFHIKVFLYNENLEFSIIKNFILFFVTNTNINNFDIYKKFYNFLLLKYKTLYYHIINIQNFG